MFTNLWNNTRRSVALICATLHVSAKEIRAAQYSADDVITAAKKFEDYLNGESK